MSDVDEQAVLIEKADAQRETPSNLAGALATAEQTVQNAKYGMEAMDSRPVVLARALLALSAANPEFAECADCAAKPGSPTLCRACLHNRTTINRLRAEREELTKVYVLAARLRTFPVPFDDHFQLVGAVDECRSVLEPNVDDYESAPDPTSEERAT